MNFFKKIPLGAWAFLLLIVLISSLSFFRAFNNLELLSYDLRFKLRPPITDSSEIIIIEISDDTINSLGKWPLPRDFHATLVNVLSKLGAKAVIFDVLFDTPKIGEDEVFAQSIKEAGNVYLPLAFYLGPQEKNYLPPKSDEILSETLKPFKEVAAGIGYINVLPDPDGKVRRVPLYINYKGNYIPHLSLKAACDSFGLDVNKVEFAPGKVIINKSLSLPVCFNTSFLVNYPDTWAESFQHCSYVGVLKSYIDGQKGLEPKIDLSQFQDSFCFVGYTATGTHDYKPNPLEGSYAMLGLQASVLNSLITNNFIKDIGRTPNTVITLIVFSLIIFICLRISPLRSLLVSFGFAFIYFLISLGLFIFLGIWIDLFFPLVIIAGSWAGVTLYNFIAEARKRELLEKELDIAKQIQKSFLPQDIKKFLDIEIFPFMQPAKFVAGDLYDVVVLDDKRLGVFIGDVSGKGVPAALIMSQTVSLFRVFAKESGDPAIVLNKVNKELCRELQGRFVTAIYLIVDSQEKTLKASCAGHSPIVFYNVKEDKVEEYLPSSGPPLGVMDIIEYDTFSRNLTKGDKFLLYTDGVSEARNRKGDEYGEEKIKALLGESKNVSTEETLNIFKQDLFQFFKGLPQHDDITLILMGLKK